METGNDLFCEFFNFVNSASDDLEYLELFQGKLEYRK